MSATILTLHLQAADGATATLTVPLPVIRQPAVRVADIRAYAVENAQQWDGTRWQPVT